MSAQQHTRSLVFAVSTIAALAGLLFGFDTGIISGALLFIQKDFVVTTKMTAWIVSSVLLGAMAGSLLSGHLTDVFGRRRLMLLVSVLFIAGTAVAALASQLFGIIAGRILIGVAIGIGSYTAPLYIAEIAPPHLRGGLVTLNQLAITIGILCSYLIDYAFSSAVGAWRWMFAMGLVPAILLSIGMLFLPESPRWLVMRNYIDKARDVLTRLRNDSAEVTTEINQIQHSLKIRQASFAEIFQPWILPVLFFGAMLGLIQQVTGINAIIYYAPTIFQLAGFHDAGSSILATVGIGVVNVASTIIAIFLLDRAGRRPLLLVGLVGMFVSLVGLAYVFAAGAAQANTLRWVALGCTFFYIICFAFGLGAILWLMVSEIFPLEVRGAAMGVAVFSCWLWNFAVSFSFPLLLKNMGPAYIFTLYAVLCVLSFIFCYFKSPETRGITLEEIEENIRKRLPLRAIGQQVSK